MLTHTSPLSWLPLNKLLISARLKSGKTSDKSWSFSILVTQATFPVARRMCTSAHCVHQQLQRLALKMLVSLFLAFNPGEKKTIKYPTWNNHWDFVAIQMYTFYTKTNQATVRQQPAAFPLCFPTTIYVSNLKSWSQQNFRSTTSDRGHLAWMKQLIKITNVHSLLNNSIIKFWAWQTARWRGRLPHLNAKYLYSLARK